MMLPPKTGVEHLILQTIANRGGRVIGLQPLVRQLGIDYPWAYTLVYRLEARGCLRVSRDASRRGRPLILEVSDD